MSDLQSYTFWQLVTQYKIEIPIIQRDYAHGRLEAKASEIREKFLKDLLEILESPNQTLNLDFVYGTIDSDVFIPIDGQQRLTTLYLLHWYLAIKFNQNFKVIKGFTYKTRISSRDFCTELTKSIFELNITEQQNISLKKNTKNKIPTPFLSFTIKNSSWYFLSWNSDPTVQSMLNTLDSIHIIFKNVENDVWSKLIEPIAVENNLTTSDSNRTPVLSFKFLNLKDFKLGEELYLKMNGRGKPLSEFEKFKALIIGHISDLKWTNLDITNIDNKWTDLLWLNRKQENKTIDDVGINLIKNIAFINYFKNHSDFKGANNEIDYEETYTLFLNKTENTSFLKKDFKLCFNHINDYNFLYSTFDILINNLDHIKFELKKQLFEGQNETIRESIFGKSDFRNRTYLYAIVQYYSNNLDLENFEEWFRVLRNLIENTDINSTNFANILNSIELLSINSKFLQDILLKTTGFAPQQIKEEILKLRLIEKDFNWKVEIIDLENHLFFKGCIGFLLPKLESPDLKKFEQRKNVSSMVFNEKGITVGENTNLFGRVLLANGLELEYGNFLWLGGKLNQYWKGQLKNSHYFPSLILSIDLLINIPFDDFGKNLESFLESKNIIDFPFWKKYLIKSPELFREYSSYGKILKDWRGTYLYEQQNFSDKSNGIYIESDRNEIINKFLKTYNLFLIDPSCRKCLNFFGGKNIEVSNEKIKLTFEKESLKVYIIPEYSICLKEYLYLDYNNDDLLDLFGKDFLNYSI